MMLIKKRYKIFFLACSFTCPFLSGQAKAFNDLAVSTLFSNSSNTSIVVSSEYIKAKNTAIIMNMRSAFPLHPSIVEFAGQYQDQHSVLFDKIKKNKKYYLDLIDKIFKRYELPSELKYIAIVESKLKTDAVSSTGASGIWQFMPSTGELFGLTINDETDERSNAWKSSVAAGRYLKYLYKIYHDWLLVVAAYNSGPGFVNKAIKKAGSKNFWDLQYFLPKETRMHVKKFIATHYYFEGKGSIVTISSYKELETKDSMPLMQPVVMDHNNSNRQDEKPEEKKQPEHMARKLVYIYYQDEEWTLSLKK